MKLLLVGASVRAAAMSAARAGCELRAGDLFADTDLLAIVPSAQPLRYPDAVADFVAASGCEGWLYTGALENHPEIIALAAEKCPLLGNAAAVVRLVRDPLAWTERLAARGIDVPRVAREASALVPTMDWLRKPLKSAGGAHITAWSTTRAHEPAAARRGAAQAVTETAHCAPWYFQQRLAGRPFSASFLAARGRAVLLGTAWQLVGSAWAGATGFRYCGSITWPAPPPVLSQCQQLGQVVAEEFGLTGLFGIDAIWDDAPAGPRVWPIEINPRYTASMELFERGCAPANSAHRREPGLSSPLKKSTGCTMAWMPSQNGDVGCYFAGRLEHAPDLARVEKRQDPVFQQAVGVRSLVGEHLAACLWGGLPAPATLAQPLAGKAIIFAERPTRVSTAAVRRLTAMNGEGQPPSVADLPRAGTWLRQGWPLVSVFAEGESVARVEAGLRAMADRVRAALACGE